MDVADAAHPFAHRYGALTSGAYDVVITSPHMRLDNANVYRVHRLIVDESHLLGGTKAGQYGNVVDKCAPLTALPSKWTACGANTLDHTGPLRVPSCGGAVADSARYTWLVSGTPFEQFSTQVAFLGLQKPLKLSKNESLKRTEAAVPTLKKLMIRQCAPRHTHAVAEAHVSRSRRERVDSRRGRSFRWTLSFTASHPHPLVHSSKSQQIHGEDALSLPDCTSRAEVLDMSPQERALYDIAACLDGCPTWLSPYAKEKHVDPTDRIGMRRKACSHCYESVERKQQREHQHFHKWPAAARAAWSGLHPTPASITDPNDQLYSGTLSPTRAHAHP
jgi:hypothetical protein